MLDDNNEPRVFYYGTNADFTLFDRSKSEKKVHLNVLGDGNYFTAKRDGAKRYGVHRKKGIKGNLATPIGEQAPINTPKASNGTVSDEIVTQPDEKVKRNFSAPGDSSSH